MASADIDAPWMNKMTNVDKNHDGSISHPELKEYLMKETKSSNYAKNANIYNQIIQMTLSLSYFLVKIQMETD